MLPIYLCVSHCQLTHRAQKHIVAEEKREKCHIFNSFLPFAVVNEIAIFLLSIFAYSAIGESIVR